MFNQSGPFTLMQLWHKHDSSDGYLHENVTKRTRREMGGEPCATSAVGAQLVSHMEGKYGVRAECVFARQTCGERCVRQGNTAS